MGFNKSYTSGLASVGLVTLLTACNGGGSSNSETTGTLTIGITDAPTTGRETVCLHFTSISLHHSDGTLIEIAYDPSTYIDDTGECINNVPVDALPPDDPANNAVNLSSLQGELSTQLINSEQVKAGPYNWIRLAVDESLSYVIDDGAQKTLSCPSCAPNQSGLKLNRGITVPAGGAASFMIDLDLTKSLKRDPSGDYMLRPTLRLVDMTETGAISGTVDATLIPASATPDDNGCSVYVYAGHGIVPDDYHDADNILTSAKVDFDATIGRYEYTAAYLPADPELPTDYTVALSCDQDDPELDQNNDPTSLNGNDVIFTDGLNLGIGLDTQVHPNISTTVNFPAI